MTLADYITAHLERRFEWGQHDCVLFAAGWIEAKTGTQPLAMFPTWASAKEAIRIVRQLGGLEAALDARYKRIHPNLAKDGDLALFDRSVCLFSGPHVVGPGINGLVFVDRTKVSCAWGTTKPIETNFREA